MGLGTGQFRYISGFFIRKYKIEGKNSFIVKLSIGMKKNMKGVMNKCRIFLCLCLLFTTSAINGQNLIPSPVSQKLLGGKVRVKSIDARIDKSLNLPAEGYSLKIKGNKAIIRAKDHQGLVWAKATLRQLEDEKGMAPQTSIVDYPAFPIRGFMHDTGRNFRSVAQLKKELDLFSFYKLNTFHWHLTDNPASRIESKAFPQLNDPKFQRKDRDQGKYYTYDEIRDVIAYAKERGITIIPEIDMPGHSEYFTNAFGFPMASKEGMKVLETWLQEFFTEIPRSLCPYIHFGSDEITIDHPKEFMAFCERMAKQYDREVLAWNPGLEGSNEVIYQVWRAAVGEAIEKTGCTHRYIDSYMGYLDTGNPIFNLYKCFMHTPCGVEKADGKALGGILCLWNDVRVADKALTFPHNGMPEALLPFSERFWGGGKGVSVAEEDLIPAPETSLWKKMHDFEKKMAYHRDRFLKDWDVRWVGSLDEHWEVSLPERRGTDIGSMKWVDAWGGVVDIKSVARKHHVEILPTMDAWMRTRIFSPKDTVVYAWVGFETPARSNRMSDGIGYQGQWEAQGRLFVNGNEIFPPEPWNEPGKYRSFEYTWHTPLNEIPYTNEQFFWMRKPASIPLKAGENIILLYCSRVFPNETWFASFIPLSMDASGHVSEVKGISFSETRH